MNFQELISDNFEQIMKIGFNSIKDQYKQVTVTNAVNYFHSKNTQEEAIFPLVICYSLLKKNGYQLDKITKKGFSDLWISYLIEKFNNLP